MSGFGWNWVNGKFSSLFTYTYFHSSSNITCFSVIVHYRTIWNCCCFGNSTSHWHMLLLQWLGRPLEGITSRVNNVGCTLRQKSGIYQQMWLWILKGNTRNEGPGKITWKWCRKMSFTLQWKTWTI
jgi:hypothetical protein